MDLSKDHIFDTLLLKDHCHFLTTLQNGAHIKLFKLEEGEILNCSENISLSTYGNKSLVPKIVKFQETDRLNLRFFDALESHSS